MRRIKSSAEFFVLTFILLFICCDNYLIGLT
jgi:hypothetical protein